MGSLKELRGRTELLTVDPEIAKQYDFSAILDRSNLPKPLTAERLAAVKAKREAFLKRVKEDALVEKIKAFFNENPSGTFTSMTRLTTKDRAFGARIAGVFAKHLENNPSAKIILNTIGCAGQGFAAFMPKGITVIHDGPVNDGCGKSMSGGTLVIKTPADNKRASHRNTIAGNAMLYGASGGNIVVNGNAGHRFGILMKGAQVVVEGVGDLAFEYMTDGTAMILGKVGNGLCTGARGGIVFAYNPNQSNQFSDAVRPATPEERDAYTEAMREMLQNAAPHSTKAADILAQFNPEHFSILIPMGLDNIKTFREVLNVIETYHMKLVPITAGMQVWLEQKILGFDLSKQSTEDCDALRKLLFPESEKSSGLQTLRNKMLSECENHALSNQVRRTLTQRLTQCNAARPLPDMEDAAGVPQRKSPVKQKRQTKERLSSISGFPDYQILSDALNHISTYASQLTHDAQGCSGCRAQSCAGAGEKNDTGCPSGKAINTINDLLKKMGTIDGELTQSQWRLLRQAFEVQIESSPFIAYTGAACPAPCESACTESIPDHGPANPNRDGKLIGEPVHIRNIEWALDQVGRSLKWFDSVFTPVEKIPGKKLVIVGSGPAAMQMAFEALRAGIAVEMYEKSDKPGGLLQDGIPHHKFDKKIIHEDFERLKKMGLRLHLNSKVDYDSKTLEFKANNVVIATGNDSNTHVALCVGSGAPRELSNEVTQKLDATNKQKIIQAVDFLKAANDVADLLQHNPDWTDKQKDDCIKEKFGAMDPRGKKIIVLGVGGDTSQDVIRWLTRYITNSSGKLLGFGRGAEPAERAGTYPHPSGKLTAENEMRLEEIQQVGGEIKYHEAPISITCDANGQLTITTEKSVYKNYDEIQADSEAKKLWDALPPEKRQKERLSSPQHYEADLVICALGFNPGNTISIVKNTTGLTNVFVAGDTSDAQSKIIVGAQANASDTWRNKIASWLLGVAKKSLNTAHLFAQKTRHPVPHNVSGAAPAALRG